MEYKIPTDVKREELDITWVCKERLQFNYHLDVFKYSDGDLRIELETREWHDLNKEQFSYLLIWLNYKNK